MAESAARSLHARAFTLGDHIAFGRGEYRPETAAGRRLLAHELTHVLQQQTSTTSAIQRQSNGDDEGQDRYCPSATIDGERVDRYIQDALDATAPGRFEIDLNAAFKRLRAMREDDCCNVDLAAAEHYMWARFEVATGGRFSYRRVVALINMYSTGKAFRLPLPLTGKCPMTSASTGAWLWAHRGARHGRNDRALGTRD